MNPDGDDLDVLVRVVQSRMVVVRNAMAAEVAMPDEEQRKRARRDRLVAQLTMLEAARRAYRLGTATPRPPLPAESVRELEERHGFVPGTYAAAVGRPSGTRAVPVEQDLDLAIQVTQAQLAAGDGPIDRAFTAAVFRICCATVIGALVGAPLGALAAHENIVLKMAEAAVVVGLGATTAEIIGPISVRLTREPAAPPDVTDGRLATTAARDVLDVVSPSDLADDTARGRLKKPDDESPVRPPIPPPVRPPFDDGPVRRPARRPFDGPGPF